MSNEKLMLWEAFRRAKAEIEWMRERPLPSGPFRQAIARCWPPVAGDGPGYSVAKIECACVS
jgi:hypothetical protein